MENNRNKDFDENAHKKSSAWSTARAIQTFLLLSAVLATVFTLWNPYKLFYEDTYLDAASASIRKSSSGFEKSIVGIVIGHWKIDSGNICENGIIEININEAIANQISSKLENLGYIVKLLSAKDLELINFSGDALVSLYSGSCEETLENESGFILGTKLTGQDPTRSNTLAVCLGEIYGKATNLDFAYKVLGENDPEFEIFNVINPQTPAVMLEMGSLLHDQSLLVNESEKVINGIVNGIQCFFNSERENE